MGGSQVWREEESFPLPGITWYRSKSRAQAKSRWAIYKSSSSSVMGESTVTRTRHGCLRQSSGFPQRSWDGRLVRGPGVLPGYQAVVTLAKPGTIWWHHISKVHQLSMEGWTSSSWNHSSHTSEVSTGMGNIRWGRIISGLKAQTGSLNSWVWILLGHLLPGWSRGPWFTSRYLSILNQSTASEQ